MIRRSASVPDSRRRRRPAVLAAGVLLMGAPLLAACGTPHAGAAAVVGGEHITVSALQKRVNDVRAAQSELRNGDQVMQQSGNLANATLYGMVLDRVVEQALDDAGLKVSRAELQRFRREHQKANGGAEMLAQLLLQQQGVTKGEIDSFFRTQLGVEKIAKSAGADLRTPTGQEQVGKLLAKTSEELGVDVNPRYGTWDFEKLTINPSEDRWLKPRKGQQA